MSNDTAFLMLAFHHVKKSKVNVLRWDVPKKGMAITFYHLFITYYEAIIILTAISKLTYLRDYIVSSIFSVLDCEIHRKRKSF